MEQILDQYGELVGRTLLRATAGPSAVDASKSTITLKTRNPLTKTEAIMALETVLGMNGITVVPISDKFAKVVTEAAAPQVGARFSTNGVPEMGRFLTQIAQFRYVAADDVLKALQPFAKSQASIMVIPSTQTLVLRDYAENVKRMLEMIERIDIPSTFEIKPEVIKIKYALASDIQQVLGSLGSGGGLSVGKSMGGGGLGQSGGYRSSASMGSSGGMGSSGSMGSMGSQSGMGATTGGATGTGASAGSGARSSFQSNLAKIIHNAAGGSGGGDFQILGQSKIIADERTNSLLVFANEDDMKMIKLIIDKLDVVLAQVLIEAIILEVTLGDSRDLGISYLQHPHQFGNTKTIGGLNNMNSGASGFLSAGTNLTSALPGGFSYFTTIGNDLDIVATAIANDSRANVLSRPRIQTSHAVPASLFVGQTVPYVTGSYYNSYGGGNNSQYSQLDVGISLEVLPLINPDGLVVMDIRQDIQQIGSYVKIDGNDVPQTTKRNADAKVAVRDRETIMLGGFISASKSKTHSGIPVLMDIPFLGALFRSTSDKNDKVELIVLIRPTVLPTPQAAALFAGEERNKMSGVKQAELDIREDERKRNEAIEVQLKKEQERKDKRAKKDAKNGVAAPSTMQHYDDNQSVPQPQKDSDPLIDAVRNPEQTHPTPKTP